MAARDRDDRHGDLESEHDMYDDSPPRSIFAATWFRAVLILIVLGVIGAVAVPYILDVVSPPAGKTPVIARPASPPPAAPTLPPAPPPPADKPTEAPPPAMPAPPIAQEAPPAAPKMQPPRTATANSPTTGIPSTPAKAEPVTPAIAPGAAKDTATALAAASSSHGTWWVQVGAFKQEAAAKRLIDKLRADNYAVQELTYTPTGARAAASAGASSAVPSSTTDQYDVVVSGTSVDDVNRRLAARGLSSRPSAGGLVVTPSLPLRDAVKLSQALAVEGLKVQVKRAAGAEGTPTAASAPNGAAITLYRVRVGGFADRAAAQAAARELEAKGYKPFVGRG